MEQKTCGNCGKCKCHDKKSKDEDIQIQDVQSSDGSNRKFPERRNFDVVVDRGGQNFSENVDVPKG